MLLVVHQGKRGDGAGNYAEIFLQHFVSAEAQAGYAQLAAHLGGPELLIGADDYDKKVGLGMVAGVDVFKVLCSNIGAYALAVLHGLGQWVLIVVVFNAKLIKLLKGGFCSFSHSSIAPFS